MSTHPEISQVLNSTAALRNELLNHPVYDHLNSLDNLRRFTEMHVFAVWDFMSLLKALQRGICDVKVPWVPSKYQSATRFINEIVVAEESDENGRGGFCSHFELYLASMEQLKAKTQPVHHFLDQLSAGATVADALQHAQVPRPAQQFVNKTFEFIDTGDLCAIASAFSFGREGLLPELFPEIVKGLHADNSGELEMFLFYLNRHIELDGDEHGPMADRLIVMLCEDDPVRWQTVESTAIAALQARKLLWDGMLDTMTSTPHSADSIPVA